MNLRQAQNELMDKLLDKSGAAPLSALPVCSPAAQRVREEVWAQFCDWWTGREHAKEVKDFAFTLFALGYEAGEMANAPMRIVLERLLNWWRCDGGMDTLGRIMDDLEAITNDTQAP